MPTPCSPGAQHLPRALSPGSDVTGGWQAAGSSQRGPMSIPSKWKIAQHWDASPRRSDFAPHLLLDEPCCFACGWFSERWSQATPQASWQRANLDRAHIIPRSLGGPDDASNLLLLCRPCHQESPDWIDPEQMARWIATRGERSSRELETFMAWLAAAEKAPDFKDALASVVAEEGATERVAELLQGLLDRAGTHFGIGFSQGTRVAVLQTAADEITRRVQQAGCEANEPRSVDIQN
ncbi:HNH endonuclease [Streptomyces sp. NPDC056242]|uniref:HNH endonuclease n=2 Tax=Streptomyces TaxID=1883 RepID=UPI0035DAA158